MSNQQNGEQPQIKVVDFRDEVQRGDTVEIRVHPDFDPEEPILDAPAFRLYARPGDVLIVRVAQDTEEQPPDTADG